MLCLRMLCLKTVLNRAGFTSTDLAPWLALHACFHRACERPSVARALADGMALFREEQARRNAA
jgi:glutathione S-transferase